MGGNPPLSSFQLLLKNKGDVVMAKGSNYVKEYRAMLEKLLETKVRIADCANIKQEERDRLQTKIDGLIDKLIVFCHKSLDKSIKIMEGRFEDTRGDDD
jgi:phage regulator Rha-like protein